MHSNDLPTYGNINRNQLLIKLLIGIQRSEYAETATLNLK